MNTHWQNYLLIVIGGVLLGIGFGTIASSDNMFWLLWSAIGVVLVSWITMGAVADEWMGPPSVIDEEQDFEDRIVQHHSLWPERPHRLVRPRS